MNFLYKYSKYFFLLMLFVIVSCQNPFNPGIKDNDSSSNIYVYPPNSPDNVLRNLSAAYNQKDIEMYKACLSSSFRFQILSTDVNTIGVDWWGFEQEVEYHKNLFSRGSSTGLSSPDNITLNLEIPPQSAWVNDNQVGHENWIIIACPFYLSLQYTNFLGRSAFGYARFYMKMEDGRWVIAIWVDESVS